MVGRRSNATGLDGLKPSIQAVPIVCRNQILVEHCNISGCHVEVGVPHKALQ